MLNPIIRNFSYRKNSMCFFKRVLPSFLSLASLVLLPLKFGPLFFAVLQLFVVLAIVVAVAPWKTLTKNYSQTTNPNGPYKQLNANAYETFVVFSS